MALSVVKAHHNVRGTPLNRTLLSTVLFSLLTVSPAFAQDDDDTAPAAPSSEAPSSEAPSVSSDFAFVYGRNVSQGLNVTGFALEIKKNIGTQLSVGGRLSGLIGVSLKANENSAAAKAYSASPILLKGEYAFSENSKRPYVGLGLGPTFYGGAGAVVTAEGNATQSNAYASKGPALTVMPEIGYDLGRFRIALQHNLLLGSAISVSANVTAGTTGTSTSVDYKTPGMGSTTLQIGGHWGGPKS